MFSKLHTKLDLIIKLLIVNLELPRINQRLSELTTEISSLKDKLASQEPQEPQTVLSLNRRFASLQNTYIETLTKLNTTKWDLHCTDGSLMNYKYFETKDLPND